MKLLRNPRAAIQLFFCFYTQLNGEGELKGQPANPGSPGKMAVKTECVCVVYGLFTYLLTAIKREISTTSTLWLKYGRSLLPVAYAEYSMKTSRIAEAKFLHV